MPDKKTAKSKLVKMKSKAPSPQWVPGVGEVPVEGEFEVSEEQAKELEKGLYERAKPTGGTKK